MLALIHNVMAVQVPVPISAAHGPTPLGSGFLLKGVAAQKLF